MKTTEGARYIQNNYGCKIFDVTQQRAQLPANCEEKSFSRNVLQHCFNLLHKYCCKD